MTGLVHVVGTRANSLVGALISPRTSLRRFPTAYFSIREQGPFFCRLFTRRRLRHYTELIYRCACLFCVWQKRSIHQQILWIKKKK